MGKDEPSMQRPSLRMRGKPRAMTIQPICIGCRKFPADLPEYSDFKEAEETSDDYVKREEGTYNPENGHFLCDGCYIIAGMPASAEGWIAP